MNEYGRPLAENALRPGKSGEEMSPGEKSSFRNKLVVILMLSLAMAFAMPLILVVKFRNNDHVWKQPNARVVLLLLLLNSVVFLIIPAVALITIYLRKRRFGSYYPTGADLVKRRTRHLKPKPLWKRVLTAVFEVFAAVGFTVDAMHGGHWRAFLWMFASFLWLSAAIAFVGIFNEKWGIAKLGRRDGFACPGCGSAPPIRKGWKCNQCHKGFDTFLTRAVCPHCGWQHQTTICPDCKELHPMNEWIFAYTARNCGSAGG